MLTQQAHAKNLLEGSIKTIDGKNLDLKELLGKTVLVVNIATRCGYTKQLKGLENLNQKYKTKGLFVLGVPSNEFGAQTPEQENDVKTFCELNYGVTFTLTAKTNVKGKDKHSFIAKLIATSQSQNEIAWNFEKFLLNKNGELVERFSSQIDPSDAKLVQAIEKAL